ncbi:unnamed protein product [Cuscuta campestris]|uniref:Uncharacterized protein n=1 Tax=Cuscuta campestris TaxID=132261 RepID=A0A484LXH4_9ASTE|nr:unnamed protein product [Cuscuta campestris]
MEVSGTQARYNLSPAGSGKCIGKVRDTEANAATEQTGIGQPTRTLLYLGSRWQKAKMQFKFGKKILILG